MFTLSVPAPTIVLYQIDDATPGGGSYYINGVQQPAQQNLTLTASQLAQTVFKTGFDTSDSLTCG